MAASKRQRHFWVDMHGDWWGIECDDHEFTVDGHYTMLVGPTEKDRERAEQIVSVLNTYLPPKREVRHGSE